MRGSLVLAFFSLLWGCGVRLGRPDVHYSSSPAPIPLVHTEKDPRRWYIPTDESAFGAQVFFFDTGYGISTCDDDFVASLGLKTFGRLWIRGEAGSVAAKKAVLPDFHLGGHRISGLVCAVRDLNATSSIRDSQEVQIAGVIGSDVLRQFGMRIDPHSALIELNAPAKDLLPNAHRLHREGPFSSRYTTEIVVDGKSLRVLIDTGASDSWLDGDSTRSRVTGKRDDVVVKGSGKSGSKKKSLTYYEAERLEWGGHMLERIPFIGRDRTPGLLGLTVLSRYIQEYEFAQRRVRLTPVSTGQIPSWEEWRASTALAKE